MKDFLLTAAELRERGGGKWRRHPPQVLPAFVADMDFKVAPAVHEAMRRFTDRQDYERLKKETGASVYLIVGNDYNVVVTNLPPAEREAAQTLDLAIR